MSKTLNLTNAYLDRATYDGNGKSKDIRWDTQIRNFGVRVYPSGQKSFVLFYRFNGHQRLMKIGAYGVKTIGQARKEARERLVAIEKGTDPMADRSAARAAATLEQLCADYIERYALTHKRPRSCAEDERLIRRYLADWNSRKCASIKKTDVAQLHHSVGKTSRYEANRVKSLLSKMFNCAKEWGFLPPEAVNPALGIENFPETKRKRYVRPDELPKLVESLDQEQNPFVRAAFWIYLLTGLRKSELLSSKWEHVSGQEGDEWTLYVPETKSGEPLTLPLSPPAVAVLKQIPRQMDNPYIFAGHIKGRPLVGIHKNWDVVRRRAGLSDIRIHDLRHTVGSWLTQSGATLYLTSKILNHADQSTTQRYAHLEQEQMRAALNSYADRLMSIAKQKAFTK